MRQVKKKKMSESFFIVLALIFLLFLIWIPLLWNRNLPKRVTAVSEARKASPALNPSENPAPKKVQLDLIVFAGYVLFASSLFHALFGEGTVWAKEQWSLGWLFDTYEITAVSLHFVFAVILINRFTICYFPCPNLLRRGFWCLMILVVFIARIPLCLCGFWAARSAVPYTHGRSRFTGIVLFLFNFLYFGFGLYVSLANKFGNTTYEQAYNGGGAILGLIWMVLGVRLDGDTMRDVPPGMGSYRDQARYSDVV